MKKEWSVNGYAFRTQNDVDLAKSELEKIAKLEEKMDYENMNMIKMVYQRAVSTGMFKTQIGYDYLKKLQDILKMAFPDEAIEDIPVGQIYMVRSAGEQIAPKVVTRPKKTKPKVNVYQEKYNHLLMITLFLAVLVVAMFFMAKTSKNPNVLNYEKAVQSKYAVWEEELNQREQAIREKERQLLE